MKLYTVQDSQPKLFNNKCILQIVLNTVLMFQCKLGIVYIAVILETDLKS
jgi:hypothetical protein